MKIWKDKDYDIDESEYNGTVKVIKRVDLIMQGGRKGRRCIRNVK